jgi:hypothetical protein
MTNFFMSEDASGIDRGRRAAVRRAIIRDSAQKVTLFFSL